MRAYANGNGTASASSARGQQMIRQNMQAAGATTRQINAAARRAANLPNARVTRVAGR